MKKILLSAAMVSMTFAFAQKKEINAAFKAVDGGDMAKAAALVSTAENAIGGNAATTDPELMEKFYYAKGVSLLKSGKTQEGAEVLAKISDLKSDKFTPSLTPKIGNHINPILQASNKAAMDAYSAKKYAEAAPKFTEIYNLLKGAGQDNKQYLYYTALSYALAKNNAESIRVYNDLINSGYTGVETTYTAKNKKTGEVENMDKNTWDLYKKMEATGDYTDFKTETSKSVEQELYETTAALLIDENRNDEALALLEKGTKKFPQSARLSELQGSAYFKAGKTAEFAASLRDQLSKNPNDANNWYNLGVLQSKDPATQAEAIASYKKAVELNPKFSNAWQNLTYTIMGDDGKSIDEYQALRKAGKLDQANKVLEERRKRLASALPYAEKWYESDTTNIDAVTLLKGLYQSTKNEAKAAEFKAKEEAMKK